MNAVVKEVKLSRMYKVGGNSFDKVDLKEPTYGDMITDPRFFNVTNESTVALALSYTGLSSAELNVLASCDVIKIAGVFNSFLDVAVSD